MAYSVEMGQKQSTSLPSKEEILRRTKGGRDVVNQVFDWMISRTSLRELYALANPEQCKKYIFLTADALDVLFKKIELEPREGPKGLIYFQKVSELTKTEAEDDPRGKQRQVICLKLAFLYVRIFQVFASLSLSILDTDPSTDVRFYQELGRLKGIETEVPLFGQQHGGALAASKPLPPQFAILRNYLSEVPDEPSYYKFSPHNMLINSESQDADGTLTIVYYFSAQKKNKPTEKTTKNIKGRLGSDWSTGKEEITLKLVNLRDSDSKLYDDTAIRLVRPGIGSPFRDRGNRSIPDALVRAFQKLIAGEKTDAGEPGYIPTKATDAGDKGIREGLHTQTLLQAFRETMPVKAHCVSRALQLLSQSGLESRFPPEIYSSICKSKFLSDNRSLPDSGREITQEYGIYALAQLFYDTLSGATPTLSAATRDQYNAFLIKMKFVFEEVKTTTPPKSLTEVKNKLPASICITETKDRLLKVSNRDVIRNLRDIAGQMINYQINHTANVTKLLSKLFLLPIVSGKPLQIHPNVKKNGMQEVNIIAAEARNLLVEYYSQCEIMYRRGAEFLGDAARNKLVTPV